MSVIFWRTSLEMSTYVSVEISPATTTSPVVISVSQAERASGSCASTASRTVSETWSAILSGWPSVTDSDVNRKSRLAMARKASELLRSDPEVEAHDAATLRAPGDDRADVRQVVAQLLVGRLPAERLRQQLDERRELRDVRIGEKCGLRRDARGCDRVLVRRVVDELRAAAECGSSSRTVRDHDLGARKLSVERHDSELPREAVHERLCCAESGLRILRCDLEREQREQARGTDVQDAVAGQQRFELLQW